MLDGTLGEELAVGVTDHLVDVDDDPARGVRLESARLDPRIDRPELALPVVANAGVAADPAPLHPVRPVDLRVHQDEDRLDVAGVECLIGAAKDLLVGARHEWMMPLVHAEQVNHEDQGRVGRDVRRRSLRPRSPGSAG